MENARCKSKKNNKIEQIQIAIQEVIDSKQTNDDHFILLNNLISQLEALKSDGDIDPSTPPEAPSCEANDLETEGMDQAETSNSNTATETVEIVKELKKLEKQNKITHLLLSGLILLVVAWQFSEVTLLITLKQKITNPFQFVGNMFKGIVKRHRSDKQEQDQPMFATENGNESLLKLPQVELPADLVTNDEK